MNTEKRMADPNAAAHYVRRGPEWHAFHAIAAPLIQAGASYGDVGRATGLTYSAARVRCLRHSLRTLCGPGRRPTTPRRGGSAAIDRSV